MGTVRGGNTGGREELITGLSLSSLLRRLGLSLLSLTPSLIGFLRLSSLLLLHSLPILLLITPGLLLGLARHLTIKPLLGLPVSQGILLIPLRFLLGALLYTLCLLGLCLFLFGRYEPFLLHLPDAELMA